MLEKFEILVGCGLPSEALNRILCADDLTAALEDSVAAGDPTRAIRGLARGMLFVPYGGPGPERGGLAAVDCPIEEIPLPVADSESGRRFVLAFSSPIRLIECAEDENAPWLLLPAAGLAISCPADTEVLIDGGSSCGLELSRKMLLAVLLEAAGVSSSWSVGGRRLRAGLPAAEHSLETDTMRKVAARHPEVLAVHRAMFGPEEQSGPTWLAFGLMLRAGADANAAIRDAAVELEAVTGEHVTVTAIGPDSPEGSAEHFLLEHAPSVYTVDAEAAR